MSRHLLFCVCFALFMPFLKAEKIVGDSTKNGVYKVYDDSSRLILKAYYKDTLRVKTWTEYDSNGMKIKETRYRKGKVMYINLFKNGVWIASISRNGKVKKKKDCGC